MAERIMGTTCVSEVFTPEILPPFEDLTKLTSYWGEPWGINSEVGKLRAVMLHRPGEEMSVVNPAKYRSEKDAIIGDHQEFYWRGKQAPDLEKMQAEHDAYAKILTDHGVKVVYNNANSPRHLTKSLNTRDVGAAVPGGMIIMRTAPAMRRGEEQAATKTLAELGMPILKTINGSGLFEGGGFIFLDPAHVAVAQSTRCNDEGIQQLKEILEPMGIEVIVVPCPGYSLHIDGFFAIVEEKTVLIRSSMLCYFLIDWFRQNGWKVLDADLRDPPLSVNLVPLEAGKVVMMEGCGYTADLLVRNNIEVITTPYEECRKNGGGLHCATLPLIRDYV